MIEGLRPYAEYKESGLEWVGLMPAHWDQQRMKVLFRERVEKGYPNEPPLAATQTKGVVRKEDYGERTVTVSKDFHLLKLVERGDYVISLRSFQGGIEVSHCRGIISPAYTVLTPTRNATPAYFNRFFKSPYFIQRLSLFVTGIWQGQNVDYTRLSRAYLPLPPADEQKMIGQFLDHTHARIERAIRAKKKLVALLNEQKQAIVHRAVTRGLDPDVKLKPSGVPWLGDVPEHWGLSRIKNELRCLNFRRVPLSSPERGKMTKRAYDYYGASGVIDRVDDYLFDDELLLVAEDGANLVLRNLPLAIIARGKFWVNNHAHILKPNRGSIEYLAAYLETLSYRPWITGAAQPKLTKDRLMSISICIAPLNEQVAILAKIDHETGPLRAAIARIKREIALLHEYRTRLTADIVTGKLDVRDAAKQFPADAAEPLGDEAPGDDDEVTEPEEA